MKFDESVTGSARAGADVVLKWIQLIQDQNDVSHDRRPACDETDRLGFRGTVQQIADATALASATELVIQELTAEMHRHFPAEIKAAWEEMVVRQRAALDEAIAGSEPKAPHAPTEGAIMKFRGNH